MYEFAPLPSETILDVGVTSDQSYTSSNYLEALYPRKNRITTILDLMTEAELRRAMSSILLAGTGLRQRGFGVGPPTSS